MGAAATSGGAIRVDGRGAVEATRGGAVTLEDRVHLCLEHPEAHGCIVCGGVARRRPGGVSCRDCGSELVWAPAREVWVA
jgi:hypothetical protein